MNKFVKLPLFLSLTCLVAGGLLSGVVAITDPVIEAAKTEKLSKAFKEMYKDDTATVTKTITMTAEESEATGIQNINEVSHSGKESIVYLTKSKSAYEQMTFYVGISKESNTVDSYYCLEANTTSLGYGNFSNNDAVNDLYNGYDGSTTEIISGTTVTSKAVKVAIDNALEDYNSRYLGIGGGETGEGEYYNAMYGEDAKLVATIDASTSYDPSIILGIDVIEHDGEKSAVYKLLSESKWEKMTFYVGLTINYGAKIDGYCFIDSDTSSRGYVVFKDSEAMLEHFGDTFGNEEDVIVAGVTYTSKAVANAINTARKDHTTRSWGEY